MSGRSVLLTSILFITLILGLFGYAEIESRNYEFNGSVINPFPDAYQFELTNFDGEQFNLTDYRGKIVLIFFGYTHCPDVCPATLSEFKQLRKSLGERAKDVAFVFITVDPKRDDLEAIGNYIQQFDDQIFGLYGLEQELNQVWEGYYIFEELEGDAHEDDEDYLISHTSRIYLVDLQGKLRLTFPSNMNDSDMFSDISYLLSQ